MKISLAAKRVEISVISFGPVTEETSFCSATEFNAPILEASGSTPMGEAIEVAVETLRSRKNLYKSGGVAYYRPWVFLITDGAPTDSTDNAQRLIAEAEEKKEFMFFAVGVENR